MCIICIELVKQKMTMGEAKRAATEIILDVEDSNSEEFDHYSKLIESIRDLDLEKLGEVLDEGIKDK